MKRLLLLLALFGTAHAATPVVESVGVSNEAANTTTHTVTMPTGVASGNLLVANICVDGDGGDPALVFTGWTQIDEVYVATNVLVSWYYRVSDGGEGADETFTTTGNQQSAHVVLRISGDDGTPDAGVVATGNNNSPNPPAVTPGGTDDFLYIATTGYDNGTRTVTAYPTNYTTDQTNERANSSGGCGVGVATRSTTASTTDDPATFTISNGQQWGAQTIAITPAAATGIPLLRRRRE